ncbi:MAG: hypothetical protein DRP66_04780 [Planctomycetota bacterium]|nr:MAG: hypothetical protein DRP66_04780 [Planctomycetota bacterium]
MNTWKDAHHRSILKAVSWRFFGSITTMLIIFAFTGKVVLSVGIGIVEVFVKLLVYYLHERMWDRIGVGKKKHPLTALPVEKPLTEEHMQEIKEKLKVLGYISKA